MPQLDARRHLRTASYCFLLLPCRLAAQAPGGDTLAVLADVHRQVAEDGARLGPNTWPGFRPDTIPLAFVLPGRGTLLYGWPAAAPEGWSSVDGALWKPDAERGAASTGTMLQGRGVAQVVAGRLDAAALRGVAAHEAFHVFQAASKQPGRRFGAGENSMLLSRYPVFAVENEAGMALEGRLLRAALLAESSGDAVRRARAFLAVRAARQRGLDTALVAFEDGVEMNEGLAEYALHRAADGGTRPPALLSALDGLLGSEEMSPRLRFYQTGAAMAFLLDRLGPADWKARLMADDLTLHEALARAAGGAAEDGAAAGARFGADSLRRIAAARVAGLRARRAARVDSVLNAPGMLIRVAPGLNWCGFDPQNLLMVDEERWLHTRWLRACGGGTDAEFSTPVVQSAAGLEASAGAESGIRITIGGRAAALGDGERWESVDDLRIQSPAVTITAARARVERRGRTIIIHPLPPS